MKKLIPLFLMLCCLVSVTACSKDEIVSNYNQALQSIGDKGLTDDKDLQGKREFGIDSYVGNYTADYDDFSGNEIIFGGTALERDNGNKIEISCDIAAQTGNLKLILQTGTDEPKILCDTESSYNDTIELPSATRARWTTAPASTTTPGIRTLSMILAPGPTLTPVKSTELVISPSTTQP